MATTTTNLGLVKPGYNDAADIMDINNNMDTLDEAVEKLREGVAIIVDGDTASVAVPVGGYAYIKNNTHGLAEGMYKNTSSSVFPVSGGTANSTVFTTVPTGAVNDAVTSLNSKITTESLELTFTNSQAIVPLRNGYLLIAIVYSGGRSSLFGIYNNNYVVSLYTPTSSGGLNPVANGKYTGTFVWLKL